MLGKQPIFTIHAEVDAITHLGPTPYGERRVIGILGGIVRGPKLSGRIMPGGADWQLIRSDGAADIRARYTIKTDDGALIMVTGVLAVCLKVLYPFVNRWMERRLVQTPEMPAGAVSEAIGQECVG